MKKVKLTLVGLNGKKGGLLGWSFYAWTPEG